MESHILNPTYPQACSRPIGHKILRTKSDSISSESSCNQNSPEYPQISILKPQYFQHCNSNWCIQNRMINILHSSQNTSTDNETFSAEENIEGSERNGLIHKGKGSDCELEENIEVCEVKVNDDDKIDEEVENLNFNSIDSMQLGGVNSIDDHNLVKGRDYDIVMVYVVDPNSDLIDQDSEDETEAIDIEKYVSVNSTDIRNVSYQEPNSSICQDGLDIRLDPPVVSNIDESFIKNSDHEQVLDSNESVLRDVDEYFVKDVNVSVPNVDDIFKKHKLPEEISARFYLPKPIHDVDQFFINDKMKRGNKDDFSVKQKLSVEEKIPLQLPKVTPQVDQFSVTKKDKWGKADSFLVNRKFSVEENIPLPLSKPFYNVDQNFIADKDKRDQVTDKLNTEPQRETGTNISDVSINENNLEVLSSIEDLKCYLLSDMSYTEFRHKSKPYLSFEDINLDFSDLTFEKDMKCKSSSINQSDDMPRTSTEEDVISFLKTNKTDIRNVKDMEVASAINSEPTMIDMLSKKNTSTAIPTMLNYCIEKTKKERTALTESINELEDFVDVEMRNDTVIPVLEVNKNYLLEQFKATEKLNTKQRQPSAGKIKNLKLRNFNKNTSTNGLRFQDAGMKSNKNKIRQVLMATPVKSTIRRSLSPVHSDHENSSTKNRYRLPNLKGGQSFLKSEVLSSNNGIFTSRHRTCKSKKIVYHFSSDEETNDDKSKTKKMTKSERTYPEKKTCDKSCIKSNDRIGLTIKNKSEVILHCDYIDSQKDKNMDKCKNIASNQPNSVDKKNKNINELDWNKSKGVISAKTVTVREEPCPKYENSSTTLFSNNIDVHTPQEDPIKNEKIPLNDELNTCLGTGIKKEQTQKKKILSLQEYKLRRGVCSHNNSAQVNPETISHDMRNPDLDKAVKCSITPNLPDGLLNTTEKTNNDQKFFKSIPKSSRKILMNSQNKKAEEMRQKDEDMINKIPKVDNLQLKPLISDAHMMEIVELKNSVSDQTNNVNKNYKNKKELDTNKSIVTSCVETVIAKEETRPKIKNNIDNKHKNKKEFYISKSKVRSSIETVIAKEKTRPKNETSSTALFGNKTDILTPQVIPVRYETRPFDDEPHKCMEAAINKEQPQKKKKLSFQEYKLRRAVCSSNSSAQISPKTVSRDIPRPGLDKAVECSIALTPPYDLLNTTEETNNEPKFFKRIPNSSRKILMNSQNKKAEEMRQRDEDMINKIPKVDNLQLQPLISVTDTMEIVELKNSVSDQTNNVNKNYKNKKELDRNKSIVTSCVETVIAKEEARPKIENNIDNKHKNKMKNYISKSKVRSSVETVIAKEKTRSKSETSSTALFGNKTDILTPQVIPVRHETRSFDDEPHKCMEAAINKEQPQKKQKLSIQEYKLKRAVCSNNSSAQISSETVSRDIPRPGLDKAVECPKARTPPYGLLETTDKVNNEQKFLDPITEASKKILIKIEKRKAEAMRKRDEEILRKISKIDTLQIPPLISDEEMMKIVGMTQPEELRVSIVTEKPQISTDYEKNILVSIGVNTDENMFQKLVEVNEKKKAPSPPQHAKPLINFKIKESDHVLKQNEFDSVKLDKRSYIDEKKHVDKIDKARYKDRYKDQAALKSVEKRVDTKISSNSLFASIQDLYIEKEPEEVEKHDDNVYEPKYTVDERQLRFIKTKIIRDYDPKMEHGEDKVIQHLTKHRSKPATSSVFVQTDLKSEITLNPSLNTVPNLVKELSVSRKRNDSDMSLSSGESPARKKETEKVKQRKSNENPIKTKEVCSEKLERKSEEKWSCSQDRYESKYRCTSRSRSASRSRRRSHSRSSSRSRRRYRRYRRTDSPYKNNRRSRSRSYHKRRSPSLRRDRPKMSRSTPRPARSVEKKASGSLTPTLRKPTVSEISDSSTRENNTPVEERRIVYVGRLEKDINKAHLRSLFSKFGQVLEVRLHSKEDGSRYGFVTYQRARDAWSAVEAANTFPQYDVGFGRRRPFWRQNLMVWRPNTQRALSTVPPQHHQYERITNSNRYYYR